MVQALEDLGYVFMCTLDNFIMNSIRLNWKNGIIIKVIILLWNSL